MTNGTWSTRELGPVGLAAINRTGTTQLRLAFERDNNRIHETVLHSSATDPGPAQPQLVATHSE